MKLTKQLKILSYSMLCSFLVFSCSTSIPLNNKAIGNEYFSNANINTLNYSIQSNTKSETNVSNFNFDLGTKNGASFSVKITSGKKGFSLKNSSNGFSGKRSDVKLFRLYLVDSNSTNLTGSNIKFGPFDINSSSTGSLATFFTNVTGVSGSSGNGNLTFSNVGAGTYYLAIAAYNSVSTINSTTNVTNSSTNITATTNFGNFALSNSGGDSPNLNGVVTIASMVSGGKALYGLTNNGTASLGVTLNLVDVFGATLDATTTITEGSSTIPATTLQ